MDAPSISRRLRPAAVLTVALAALAAGAAEFRGRLDPAPAIGTRSGARLVPATPELIAQLPEPLAPESSAWTLGRPMNIKGRIFKFAAVELADGTFVAWLDRDLNGKFEATEKWTVTRGEGKTSLTLPWDNGIYREFPFEIYLNRSREGNPRPAPNVGYNFNVIFGAEVDLDGQAMRLAFGPRPDESAINLGSARISIDANLNGRFDADLGEIENPADKIPVFRVGARYLAPKSVDMATGEVVLEERPASDYTRFDAQPGQEMPDFAFTTLDGAAHKLSGFRGKYVLLDFWGTWCGPCIGEMIHLDPVYAKYHPRGFEVIGMNMEKTSGGLTPEAYAKDEEKVRAFIAKAGHKWLQATQRSIERVAIDVIHVNSYPTCILIGPDGKVVSREARGEVLEKLLAKHLPDPS